MCVKLHDQRVTQVRTQHDVGTALGQLHRCLIAYSGVRPGDDAYSPFYAWPSAFHLLRCLRVQK